MRPTAMLLFAVSFSGVLWGAGEDLDLKVRLHLREGNPAEARSLLENAVSANPADAAARLSLARFLERKNDPGARAAYRALLGSTRRTPATADARREAARRLVLLDLLRDDYPAASHHLEEFRADLDAQWVLPEKRSALGDAYPESIEVPGPLESFARMAAISPYVAPAELLPALARNIVVSGYQAQAGGQALQQTEYLKLLLRYLSQARELERLAGESKKIRVEACESPVTADLLRVLGFRMRGGCGADLVLETVNATRAFLSMDSGFPLAQLEEALRTNRPFELDYAPTKLPILFGASFWLGDRKPDAKGVAPVDAFLEDPSLCRLYLGLSRLDPETARAIATRMPPPKLKAFGHVLDFFGGDFLIRDGKAVVPGGERSEKAWEDLAGAPPSRGAEFFERLLTRDDGWLASFYDSLSRISGPVADYLTQPDRMKRFYSAIRGKVTSPGPARPVFRSNTDLMFLTTRLYLDASGRPHIPGGVASWQYLFVERPLGDFDSELRRAARNWRDPDDVLEALFALCRKVVENEPLKIYMTLLDLDRRRRQPLSGEAVRRLMLQYTKFGHQYVIFTERGSVSEATIQAFLDAAANIDSDGDRLRRSDAAGIFQALVGIWQILVRHDLIPEGEADAALYSVVEPFLKARSRVELFDAGRLGVESLLKAARTSGTTNPDQRLLNLLAGASDAADAESHRQLVVQMMRVLEAQRLVELDALFSLADHLEQIARGEPVRPEIVARVSGRLEDIESPRAALSSVERNSFSFGYWSDRHVENLRRLRLRQEIEKAVGKPDRLRELRGELSAVLRDTLVGLNYAHYAPPGAQVLFTNPVFVQSHDFLGMQEGRQTWRNTEVHGSGWPSNLGGRLVGSLVHLPYALAQAEQNFLIPSEEQALIWGDLVPQLIVSVKVPRWWRATPAQIHWIALHFRYAESVLAEAVVDPRVRRTVTSHLEKMASPGRVRQVEQALAAAQPSEALGHLLPNELFRLARSLIASPGAPDNHLAAEIRALASENPQEVNYEAVSRLAGTPKPVLTHSYRPELLNLRTFPTLMGFSSRILAESWEAGNLYYLALADELMLSPGALNLRVPEWARQTVERIFATHLEDWPALLRSLRSVGESVRREAKAGGDAVQAAGRPE